VRAQQDGEKIDDTYNRFTIVRSALDGPDGQIARQILTLDKKTLRQ